QPLLSQDHSQIVVAGGNAVSRLLDGLAGMLGGLAVVSPALRFQRPLQQSPGGVSAPNLPRLPESLTGLLGIPPVLKRKAQRVRGRRIFAFSQFDRRAVFSHGLARASEPLSANTDIQAGAGLMAAGPIQSPPILEDRKLVLTAIEILVASLYRLVGVVHLGLDAHGARRQRKEQYKEQ